MSDLQNIISTIAKYTKIISDIAVNGAKVCAVSAAVFGVMLLFSYLNRTSAPFPPVDASLSLFMTMFVAAFVLLMSILFVLVYSPIAIKAQASSRIKIMHPAFFEGKKSAVWKHSEFAVVYFLIYAPSYAMMAVFVTAAVLDLPSLSQHPACRFIRENSGPTIYLAFYAIALVFVLAYCAGANLISGIKKYCISDLLQLSFSANIAALVWWYYFSMLIATSLGEVAGDFSISSDKNMNDAANILFLITIFAIVAILHYRFSMGVLNYSTAAIAFVACTTFTAQIYPESSVLTSRTLKILGVGGGIPVDIDVKNYEGVSSKGIRTVRGCLILGMGSTIIIRKITDSELDKAVKEDQKSIDKYLSETCDVQPSLFLKGSTNSRKIMMAEIYNRTDVVRIGPFTYYGKRLNEIN